MGLDTGDFLERLRAETRADHDRVEGVVPVMEAGLTVAAYRQILSRSYGFYAPLEARLESLSPGFPPGLDWEMRRKIPRLRRDLAALGADAEVLARLPYCVALPELSSPARILGCLYVLEGASLGGQVIGRHLAGLAPEIAENRRFFEGYGEQTGMRWREFRAVLVSETLLRSDQDAVISAAHATFRAFAAWMSEGSMVDEC